MGCTPKELVILLVLLLALAVVAILFTGCSTSSQKVSSQNLSTPPLPVGVQKPQIAVSRAAVIAPPPAWVTLAWNGGPGIGSYTVQGSSNMINWVTQTNLPAVTNTYQATVAGYPFRFWRVAVITP